MNLNSILYAIVWSGLRPPLQPQRAFWRKSFFYNFQDSDIKEEGEVENTLMAITCRGLTRHSVFWMQRGPPPMPFELIRLRLIQFFFSKHTIWKQGKQL